MKIIFLQKHLNSNNNLKNSLLLLLISQINYKRFFLLINNKVFTIKVMHIIKINQQK